MTYKDLNEVFDESLTLPIDGRTYRVPAPEGRFGLWLQQLAEVALLIAEGAKAEDLPNIPPFTFVDGATVSPKAANISDENGFYRRLLGGAWDQLLADKVSWPKIRMVAHTVFLHYSMSAQAAEAFWNSGGSPEALRPNRQARRSTPTGGAPTTNPPASSRSTKSRRTNGGRSGRRR